MWTWGTQQEMGPLPPSMLICAAPDKFSNKIMWITFIPVWKYNSTTLNTAQMTIASQRVVKKIYQSFQLVDLSFFLYLGPPFLQGVWGTCQHCLLDNPVFHRLDSKYEFCHWNKLPIPTSFGNTGKNMFSKGGHFEIQDGWRMHGRTRIFPQKFCSSRHIVLAIWHCLISLCMVLSFPTIARYIKINMLKWWPSWKSIWLPSQYFNIYLTTLVQNVSFALKWTSYPS